METTLSNRLIKYAKILNYQGHRHSVIKAILVIFEILSDYESRTSEGEDADRFLSMLGFDKSDRKKLIEKNVGRAFYGQGFFNSDNLPELLSLIGVTSENIKIFNGYSIIGDMLSSKGKNVGEVFDNSRYLSMEGKSLLKQMSNNFEHAMVTLYYRYFEIR